MRVWVLYTTKSWFQHLVVFFMHFPQYSSVCSRFSLNNISCVKNLPYLPFSDFCRSNSLIVSGKRNPNRLVDI